MPGSRFFPPVETAIKGGFLTAEVPLTTEHLLDAYRHGIFPWPITETSTLVPWFSPDPRGILEFDTLRVSQRLARTIRGGKFQVTSDQAFSDVMQGCETSQDRGENTWITPEIKREYQELHRQGHAHSVEAWHEGDLAGGIYGVTIGGLFAGESMFYRERDASKVALVRLVEHLRGRGYRLMDIQMMTPHMQRMGARQISRKEYLKRLAAVVDLPVTFGSIATSS